jgi:hypothetical protein
VSHDAIKRRKLEALKSVLQISTSQALSNVSHSNFSTSRRASVEAVDDNENIHNAGTPKNPNTIIESVDDDGDDIYVTDTHGTVREKGKEAETEEEPEETDEEELSKSATTHCVKQLIPPN